MNIIEMTEEQKDLSCLSSQNKVIVDFYADWCAPCKSFAHMIDQIKDNDTLKDVDLVKVNVDCFQSLMKLFNVRSLPTIIFLSRDEDNNFKEVFKKIGSMDQTKFLETVESVYEK